MSEPITVEGVCIMKWGEDPYDRLDYRAEDTGVPDRPIPLIQGFQHDKIVGKAKNFRKTADGVKCDLFVQDDYFKALLNTGREVTAATKLEGTPEDGCFVEAVVDGVSLVHGHSRSSLNGNVTEAMNTG